MLKKLIKKLKNKKTIIALSIGLVLIAVVGLLRFTLSAEMEDLDEEAWVAPQSDLIYYLNISYDGIDENKSESNDNKLALVYSGIIYVEDKLPEGLEFNGFVIGSDGTVGNAVLRSDGKSYCRGSIVDDSDGADAKDNYRGLHYDKDTGKVTFKVKSLQAGCMLTVGIKTITPTIDDPSTPDVTETRRDFYNTASTREDSLTVESNTVHAYMQEDEDEEVTFYTVTYKYDKSAPPNAPTPAGPESYTEKTRVGVRGDVMVEGYKFLGWKVESPSGLQVDSSNAFIMPAQNVVFVGSFEALPKFKVKYEVTGSVTEDDLKKEGYELPSDKDYYADELVDVDSLKPGEKVGKYRFKGWKVKSPSDVTISEDNDFIMPDKDVTLVGEFELILYKVDYQFMGDTLPPSPNDYLPPSEEHAEGDEVTLASVKEPSGYKFLGWYYDVDENNKFTMPGENITIYGEWRKVGSTIRPTIKKEIIDKKDSYYAGSIVKYKITVTNTANYPIKNVVVVEHNDNAYFVEGTGYEVSALHVVTIPTIAANSSVVLNAEYKVTEDDLGTIENVVQITGATSDNNDELDPDGDYTSKAEFDAVHPASVKICKNVTDKDISGKFTFKLKGKKEYTLDVNSGDCNTIEVNPGEYEISEVVADEYKVKSVEGAINKNGEKITLESDESYEITFTNAPRTPELIPNTLDNIGKTIIKLAISLIATFIIITILYFRRTKKA